MGTNLSDVISKVQKLLRVAASSDKAGEIEAAQSRAQELITKYQIEEAQLNGHIVKGDIVCQRIDMPKPYVIDKSVLLNSIAKHNFCKVLRGDDYCFIYGCRSDIDLCIALYNILSIHMVSQMQYKLDLIKASLQEKVYTKPWIKSFFGGYSIGISERIKESKSKVIKETESSSGNSIALIIRDKEHAVEEYFQKVDRKKSSYDRKLSSSSGFNAGIDSAREADINQSKLER